MSITEQFLPKKDLQIHDPDAALRTNLSSGDKLADKQKTAQLADQIAEFQNLLFAQKKHKLLVILQGMDTSGKDSVVKTVFGQINPIGGRAYGFKAPSAVEMSRDYLWRVHQQVPATGEIVIFNRSHYEEVLITKVHGQIDQDECERRYKQINDFERMLSETGTVIMKFFLHISKAEQKRRLEERLTDPTKQWKFDPLDLAERQHWNAYQSAYEKAIQATNTDYAPWYLIPSDSKTQRNLLIALCIVERLESLHLRYPASNPELETVKIV